MLADTIDHLGGCGHGSYLRAAHPAADNHGERDPPGDERALRFTVASRVRREFSRLRPVKEALILPIMKLQITEGEADFARQLDAVGWGLFIVWIGIAILLHIGWGWGLFGVALIILAGAAIRSFKGLPIQGFWVAVGVLLLACAIWEFFALAWPPLLPVLIIGFGVVVLLGAFRARPPRGPRAAP